MRNDVILGEKAFAAISAVEGLKLSDTDRNLIAELRGKGLSNDEIRKIILADSNARRAA
jgi:microsomal dipeptidase-like Zn-dependent dipeptidase